MRLLLGFLFLLDLGAGAPLPALDMSTTWESFGRDQGLSGSSVTGIVQDKTGYLWFSTQNGLNRWDGYTMKVWQKVPFSKNTLSHNLIQTMTLDHGDVLWLGTYGGLDRFDTGSETFQRFVHQEGVPTSLSHNVVTRIYRDTRGTLWVGTLDGLNRMNEAAGTFQTYLPGKTVRTLVEDDQGHLWIGTNGGFFLHVPESDRMVPFDQVFPGKSLGPGAVMASLRLPGDPTVWLAVWGQGLVRFDPLTGDTRIYRLPDSRLFSLDQGEPGQLNIGTWGGGLVVFRTDTGKTFQFRHDPEKAGTLAHDVVYGTFQDRGGLIWVATNGGGLSRYNTRRHQFQFYPTPGKVLVLHEGRAGTLWAGVYNGGVEQIGPDGTVRAWKFDPQDSGSLSNDIVNCITEDPRGRLWIGTNAGVSILDPDSGRVSRWPTKPGASDGLPDEVVNSIAIDRTGAFWFGTYRSGVVRRPEPGKPGLVRNFRSQPKVPGTLPDNMVYFVQEDREGRIWVGTNGGLALYRPGTDDFRVWRNDPDDLNSLPCNTVRCLLEDSGGRIWVATNGGGVSLLDPAGGGLTNLGPHEGLSNLSVYSLLEDSTGELWVTTANGLFALDPGSRSFRRFGLADGLDSAEFSAGYLKTSDGRLLFGGLSGYLELQPGNLNPRGRAPALALTGIQVLGNPRPVGPRVILGWQENSVTFSFSVLDFRNPDKNRYSYQLVGFDRDWVQAGYRHEATYTNLWPGTYHFRFRGADPNDIWSESDQIIVLVVEAAPWAAWYAWVAYAGLFFLMLYLYQKARVSRSLGQKVSELEGLRCQLEEANRRLDQLARLDGLTGIPNRRALDEWLAEEWARAYRQHNSVALLILDIDDFKRYNDFYGHPAGDDCLKAVARALASNILRTSDFCARYGGEEFVMVLHDTDLDGAKTVGERILGSVDSLRIPHQASSVTDFVTVSVGVAAGIPGGDVPVAELLQRADQALYRAKALGRHRVEQASGP